ncbi:MAG: hypothetical protein JWP09_647 [Candidatus Taylorbacteria bacterium]|nr:hypothetical protein [Candidatus Taylorbacteria bacterium]
MISQWFDKKEKALYFREKKGYSIGRIEKELGIPRSTLSGWFKNVILSQSQKDKLAENCRMGMIKGRKKAIIWHNKQKDDRLKLASVDAENVLLKIDFKNRVMVELALSMLYLGEGFKKGCRTGMGNSDPLILKFFITTLEKTYGLDRSKVSCDLHLRADQDIEKMKKFWANELNLSVRQFISVSIDKRTEGKVTYKNYNGVCVVNCGNVAIQRKLVYLSRRFCETIINMGD